MHLLFQLGQVIGGRHMLPPTQEASVGSVRYDKMGCIPRRQVCGHAAVSSVSGPRPTSRQSWPQAPDLLVSVRPSSLPLFFCHPPLTPRPATPSKLPWTISSRPEC